MKTLSGIRALVWLGMGVIAAYVIWWAFPDYLAKQEDPRSQEHLSRVAAELNRALPLMIDKETELLPAMGAPGMLIYSYRLVSFSTAQVEYKKFAAAAKQQVVQGACGRPETRDDFLKKGVTLRYSYYDKDKKHIATVDVTPADCGL
jgi:hypothetical protein